MLRSLKHCLGSKRTAASSDHRAHLAVECLEERVVLSGGMVSPIAVAADQESMPSNLAAVSSALSHSDEHYSQFITQAYEKYLGRAPEAAGLNGWLQCMKQGLSDEKLEAGFIGSPEYIARHGGQGAGWVTGMYHDLLARAASLAEVNGWVGALNGGTTATQVAFGFAASAEREGMRVRDDYDRFLGRAPAEVEAQGWVNAFAHGTSNENVVAGFVGSAENFARQGNNVSVWIQSAFQSIYGRSASSTEVQTLSSSFLFASNVQNGTSISTSATASVEVNGILSSQTSATTQQFQGQFGSFQMQQSMASSSAQQEQSSASSSSSSSIFT